MQYIWMSFTHHEERHGQLCEIELDTTTEAPKHRNIVALFSDGERIHGDRSHVRIDSAENRKRYIRPLVGKTKVCSKCKDEKDLSHFQFHKKKKRYVTQCYACVSNAIRYSGKTRSE
jgi:hypothetical protein